MEKKRVDLLLLSIYIKVTVEKTWGVRTRNWMVSDNVNAYEINHLCYIEHRD